jgi:hypothetical protein
MVDVLKVEGGERSYWGRSCDLQGSSSAFESRCHVPSSGEQGSAPFYYQHLKYNTTSLQTRYTLSHNDVMMLQQLDKLYGAI